MRIFAAPTLVLFALSAAASWAQDGAGPALRNNPFSRPAPAEPKPAPKKAAPVATKPKKQQEPPPEPKKAPDPPWEPELRGTLVAGPRSLVNVEGIVLAIGDEVDGQRLLEVREAEAVFQKGEKRVLVTMDGETVPLPDLGAQPGGISGGPGPFAGQTSPFAQALGRFLADIAKERQPK